ncbi:MAG: mechanosensitive ion channel family protein [Prevotellaceae bacterium]|jgi:miniconductance mechanosensitive channel|nr:mechanosensitive ion channel family protein [Prevotellaceae bacterium]
MKNPALLSGWNTPYKLWLSEFIQPEGWVNFAYVVSALLLCLFASILFYKLGKWISYKLTSLLLTKKKNNKVVAALKANKFFSYLCYYLPLLVFKYNFGLLSDSENPIKILGSIYHIAAVLLFVLVANSILNTIVHINRHQEAKRSKPIRGLVQFVQIILYFLCLIFCIAIATGKSPLALLAGLGAASALIMLIFKDSITGLVAGAQLSFNHMLQIGDWISLPGYDVDGEIVDITLTSVKVRNWDKSVSTVPTYNLVVNDSVKNWRYMKESGVRRISRAITIDVNSIRFCTPEMLARYGAISGVGEALKSAEAANDAPAKSAKTAEPDGITNLGVFRAYIYRYLGQKSGIRADLDVIVKHREPSASGLPLEITCFASVTDTKPFEAIQSDIFDHLIAIAPAFDLKLFQLANSKEMQVNG